MKKFSIQMSVTVDVEKCSEPRIIRLVKTAAKNIRIDGKAVEVLGIIAVEEKESEYAKALRTGVKPAIWPPIMMSREELEHFRSANGLAPARQP